MTFPGWKDARLGTTAYGLSLNKSLRMQATAVDPFAQPRDAAQQVEEEEHAHPNLRKGDY